MKPRRMLLALLLAGLSLFGKPAGAHPSLLVVRVEFATRAELQALASRFEPWEVHPEAGYALVGVDPAGLERLKTLGLPLAIDPEQTQRASRLAGLQSGLDGGIPGFSCYRTVEETYASAAALAQAHPTLAQWIDIGDTWDKLDAAGPAGYDLQVLRLTHQAAPGSRALSKPALVVTASLHGREYAPAEALIRFAEYLVNAYGRDADATWLLDEHRVDLLLQANPDGRKLAEDGADWRKNTNRNYCQAPGQYGADLNRNFAFQWGCCQGSSPEPCDETYRGPGPASEPETQAIQQYLTTVFPDQRLPGLDEPAPADAAGVFIDLHSFGELVVWPWGFTDFTTAPAPNHTALQTLGRRLAYFNHYTAEPASALYLTDGSAIDYAYGELGVAAYTFEMGTQFFESCTDFEQTIWPDSLPALVYAAKVAAAPYRLPAGPAIVDLSGGWQLTPDGYAWQLRATASDAHTSGSDEPIQAIAAAEYFIDLPPWTSPAPTAHPLLPADGQFDSQTEQIQAHINASELSAGRHSVYLHARDAAGNWGPVSAVFVDLQRSIYLPLIRKP